jgi:hypothetical protein
VQSLNREARDTPVCHGAVEGGFCQSIFPEAPSLGGSSGQFSQGSQLVDYVAQGSALVVLSTVTDQVSRWLRGFDCH